MGDWIKLKADDGHELGAYVATPAQEPVGAVVVIQVIFGVNKSIRTVEDSYAAEGFLSIAPALFDRFDPDVEINIYPGVGHAFANPDRPSYNAEAAKLADERSLAFLRKNLA